MDRRPAFLFISYCLLAAACSDTGPDAPSQEATILLDASTNGAWPTGLDPAHNTTAGLNLSLMNAVFGGLFQLTADEDGANPRITGILARSYEISPNGRRLIIRLREGLHFADGTPLDAAALRFNIERNLATPCSCAPLRWPWDEEEPVRVLDPLTIALRFKRAYPAAINGFPVVNINWPVSPTALKRLGDNAFRMKPVGAGPFRIVSNDPGVHLALERNPYYWESGRPYLERLDFRVIGNEQAAYLALLAGNAQVYEGMTSNELISQARDDERLQVTEQPPTATYAVQLNTSQPPFDNEKARRALYRATDTKALTTGLFDGRLPASQSFTGPGGLFHTDKIPGYADHQSDKAASLVTSLDGLRFQLGTLRTPLAEHIATALQSQWQAVGIDASIELLDIGMLIERLEQQSWDAMLQVIGSYDPESGSGVHLRFASGQLFSGVNDPALDQLLESASGTLAKGTRKALYTAAAQHISEQAYAPFLFAFAPSQITTGDIEGPGLTTPIPPVALTTAILWQDVRRRE